MIWVQRQGTRVGNEGLRLAACLTVGDQLTHLPALPLVESIEDHVGSCTKCIVVKLVGPWQHSTFVDFVLK